MPIYITFITQSKCRHVIIRFLLSKRKELLPLPQKEDGFFFQAFPCSEKAPVKQHYSMPGWLRNILAVAIVGCFSVVFYYFFIRPYAYRWKPCNGLKEYGVCIPSGYDIHGIDISHYQGKIDWGDFYRINRRQLLCTSFYESDGRGDHNDTTFQTNFANARNHGFIRGAYHFYIPGTDALKQADFFYTYGQTGFRRPASGSRCGSDRTKREKELQQGIKRWLDRIESHYGVKPILYTSYKFKTRYLDDSIFNAYPYWIAHYYVDSVKYQGKWDFWQHTDVGNVPGIKEDVDLNVFNGTLEELKKLTIK